MKCPVCGASYRSASPLCRRCGVDLAPLVQVYDQALSHHHRAIRLFNDGYYPEAKGANDRAIALNSTYADFHVLAGRLAFLEGQIGAALQSWHFALQLDSNHAIAAECLRRFAQIQAALAQATESDPQQA